MGEPIVTTKIPFEKCTVLVEAPRVPITARTALRPVALCLAPVEVAMRARALGDSVFFDSSLDSPGAISIVAADPQRILRGNLRDDGEALRKFVAAHQIRDTVDFGGPAGIIAGWVEYDGGFCFGLYEETLVYRHADASWHESGDLGSRIVSAKQRGPRASARLHFTRECARDSYLERVARGQEYIAAGDIYQVNLAHRLTAGWSGDPFPFYASLRHYSPAPFAAFLEVGGRAILSSSPESFLRISDRAIRTRPIKGTRPRRREPKADEKSAYDLITSPKEVAELVMITDLERNDLGQICEYGSVVVRELLQLERHEHVFHLVSTVEGRLRAEVDHVTALAACFPGGSITGAPKRRAREIISELEPVPRGLYTGAIGWFGLNGETQFNIAIRTVIAEHGRVHFHVGAGIVADSNPAQEWQETLDKAAGILLSAERLETVPA